MLKPSRLALAALVILGSAALANAQMPPTPAMPMTPPAGAPAAGRPGAMPMMDMGRMMRGGQMMPGMMQSDHIEGRIAYMKAELAITDAQLPQWYALADVMRANAKGMHDGMAKMMQTGMPTTAPARGDAMVQMMSMHLDGMKAMLIPGKALYAVLTDAQKKLADEMTSGPMGRM